MGGKSIQGFFSLNIEVSLDYITPKKKRENKLFYDQQINL